MVTEAEAKQIFTDSIHFDSLIVAKWSPETFAALHASGITGASCTISIWEDFKQSIKQVVQWKRWFEEHEGIIVQAYTAQDVRRAKSQGKTAILLSWQNTAGIEDQLDYLRVFHELGVRKMQLTYNTQNYSGAGYTELNDSGLTGFGREVVDEMAKLGMIVDLSHLCTEKGGYVGINCFGPHMPKGNDSTIDDYVAALDYTIALCGEDHVGIGSDNADGHKRPSAFMDWANKDKGYARRSTPWGTSAKVVKPLGPLENRPELPVAMARAGWSEEKIKKVLGENWLRYMETIIGS
ncbi:Metallo-dependent hydrolase [Eremomyces bilateralis CBS 781.70]|uniref:Dipeptidase n=1 Tax=Eremomyces bilateralis CBS 781.70 TaxID=1392243 RepID=A0A6G1G4B8_9PEZI|nr:Metallo-dependent hydrolase [Eremomyces bilateralis CBS 781.70]KAF1812669.1 Metallo-dependent hydrolase [Eremomyces bilateralis CBS 781.70]